MIFSNPTKCKKKKTHISKSEKDVSTALFLRMFCCVALSETESNGHWTVVVYPWYFSHTELLFLTQKVLHYTSIVSVDGNMVP